MHRLERIGRLLKRGPAAIVLLIPLASASYGIPFAGASPPPPDGGHRLIFSTYLGGSKPWAEGYDALTFAQNAAADPWGNIYVTGATQAADLPAAHAWQPAPQAGSTMSAFVAKYGPAGRLLWCTYLGGDQQSTGLGIAVMPDGGVAVVGVSSSDAAGPFPTLHAFQPDNNGSSDYFVTVFSAGGKVRYSTLLGGSDTEGGPGDPFVYDQSNGNNIAVDARGLVYLTGVTPSGGDDAIGFPLTANALQTELQGGTDAFLAIIDPSKSGAASLVYSSFLGGNHGEQGHAVAANARGSLITVAGYTRSTTFPTTPNALRSAPAPDEYLSNGFVTQLSSSRPGDPASQMALRYSTYLGGSTVEARDDAYGMALDARGRIVVTGRTQSRDFPMAQPPAPSLYNSAPYLQAGVSSDEPYAVKLDPSLAGAASLVYSTYLGGGAITPGQGSYGTGATVDARGSIYVAGLTGAPGAPYTPAPGPVEAPNAFPYTAGALLTANQGGYDAMLMQIGPYGARLAYSTFLGGTQYDCTYGLALDRAGSVILTGTTLSPDFPLKSPAQAYPGNTGQTNAFVTKFGP